MSDANWDRAHEKWQHLRSAIDAAAKAKDHAGVVRACDEAITHAARAPELAIVTWLLDKKAAKAFWSLDQRALAIARIQRAIAGCNQFRSAHGGFETDGASMEKLRDGWQRKLGV